MKGVEGASPIPPTSTKYKAEVTDILDLGCIMTSFVGALATQGPYALWLHVLGR